MIVSAGLAGSQHHKEEANRHRNLKHRLQEDSLTEPHKSCCRLLQERHTACRTTKAGMDIGQQLRQVLGGGSGSFRVAEQLGTAKAISDLKVPCSCTHLYSFRNYQRVGTKGIAQGFFS